MNTLPLPEQLAPAIDVIKEALEGIDDVSKEARVKELMIGLHTKLTAENLKFVEMLSQKHLKDLREANLPADPYVRMLAAMSQMTHKAVILDMVSKPNANLEGVPQAILDATGNRPSVFHMLCPSKTVKDLCEHIETFCIQGGQSGTLDILKNLLDEYPEEELLSLHKDTLLFHKRIVTMCPNVDVGKLPTHHLLTLLNHLL